MQKNRANAAAALIVPGSFVCLARLAEYMPNDATGRLLEQGDFSVEYLDYDWNLNKQ